MSFKRGRKAGKPKSNKPAKRAALPTGMYECPSCGYGWQARRSEPTVCPNRNCRQLLSGASGRHRHRFNLSCTPDCNYIAHASCDADCKDRWHNLDFNQRQWRQDRQDYHSVLFNAGYDWVQVHQLMNQTRESCADDSPEGRAADLQWNTYYDSLDDSELRLSGQERSLVIDTNRRTRYKQLASAREVTNTARRLEFATSRELRRISGSHSPICPLAGAWVV